jgi:hypothetical protein
MNNQCRRCACNIIRQHYIKTRHKEYKESMVEWCKLNKLDESIEWNKLMKQSNTSKCPGISLFITECLK